MNELSRRLQCQADYIRQTVATPALRGMAQVIEDGAAEIERLSKIIQESKYNGGWIYAKDRLPDKTGYYLVTYHKVCHGKFFPKDELTEVRKMRYDNDGNGWRFPSYIGLEREKARADMTQEVYAWQPLPRLPEPYEKTSLTEEKTEQFPVSETSEEMDGLSL